MKKIKAVVCLLLTITMAAVGVLGLTANAFAAPRQEVNFALTDDPSTKTVTMSITVDNAQYTDVYSLYFDFDPDILTFDSVVFGNEIVNALRSEGFDESSLNAFVKNNNTLVIAFFYLLNTASKSTNVCTVKFRYNELNRQTKITLLPSSEVASNGGGFKFESISEYVGVSFKRGDVDGDGDVTVADARLALRAAVKLEALTGSALLAADADGSDGVTVADARSILRVAVGLDSFDVVITTDRPLDVIKKYTKENGEKRENEYWVTLFNNGEFFNGAKYRYYNGISHRVEVCYNDSTDDVEIWSFVEDENFFDRTVFYTLEDKEAQVEVSISIDGHYTEKEIDFLVSKVTKRDYTENKTLGIFYSKNRLKDANLSVYSKAVVLASEEYSFSLKAVDTLLKSKGMNISQLGYLSF